MQQFAKAVHEHDSYSVQKIWIFPSLRSSEWLFYSVLDNLSGLIVPKMICRINFLIENLLKLLRVRIRWIIQNCSNLRIGDLRRRYEHSTCGETSRHCIRAECLKKVLQFVLYFKRLELLQSKNSCCSCLRN